MIYFLGGKLVILYTLGLFTWTVSFTEKVRGVQNGKLVWFFYTVIKCFTCIRHYFCSMILSTRHTDDINLPYLDHVARRPPLIRHFTTLSSQRDREMRDVYFEKRWPRISVAFRLFRSFLMWYILTLKKNWIFLFIYCTTRAFLCIIL